jgi:hypothetical protein
MPSLVSSEITMSVGRGGMTAEITDIAYNHRIISHSRFVMQNKTNPNVHAGKLIIT